MRFIAAILIVLITISCTDTTSPYKDQKQEFYPTYTRDLKDSIWTLELMYIAWACQCANWITPSEYERYQDIGKLSDHSIFIEPKDRVLELPDTLGYSGDLIRFTGQFFKNKGYPKNYPKTEMRVEKAKVFRYNKYEVLRSNYRDFISDTAAKKQ
jgi:hypothetical protein